MTQSFFVIFDLFINPSSNCFSMSQIEKRRHAMLLLEGKKHSPKEVSRIVGVSVSTGICTLISKLKHNCSYNKIGSGRPPKTLPLIGNSVAQQIRRKPWIYLRAAIAQKCPVKTSKNTGARCLKKLEYTKPYLISVPLLSETNPLGSGTYRQRLASYIICR